MTPTASFAPPLQDQQPPGSGSSSPSPQRSAAVDAQGSDDADPTRSERPSVPQDPWEMDPLWRALAPPPQALTLPASASLEVAAQQERTENARVATLEHLLTTLVRRASWSLDSDRRAAALRLEIGTGPLEGVGILISADHLGVDVVLDAPPSVDLEAWKSRLRLRLASQGLTASIS